MNDAKTVRLVITYIFVIAFTAIVLVGVLSWHRMIEVAVLVALVGIGSGGIGALGAMLASTSSKPKMDETILQTTTASSNGPTEAKENL